MEQKFRFIITRLSRSCVGAICLSSIGLWSCSISTVPRLPAYLGIGGHSGQILTAKKLQQGPRPFNVGLIILSDATAPNAAPPLTKPHVTILTDRLVQKIEQSLPLKVVEILPSLSISPKEDVGQFVRLASQHKVKWLIVTIFSGTESEEPTELGEERMMTRMPGITIESYALVEMALLEIQSGQVVSQVKGRASESLDWLTVPIGSDQPTGNEARDILRANAGEQALDRAIMRFKQEWSLAFEEKG